MNYFLDIYSPETHAAFTASDRSLAGFRVRQRNAASRVQQGDLLVCYLTRLSRWVGLLKVVGDPFEDATPRFTEIEDPYVVRFKVVPVVWLPPEQGIPIHDASV